VSELGKNGCLYIGERGLEDLTVAVHTELV
jgi:hypothetical protein